MQIEAKQPGCCGAAGLLESLFRWVSTMYSVYVCTLGLGLMALSVVLFLRRRWLLAGLPLAIGTVSIYLLFRSNDQVASDFLSNAGPVSMLLYMGIYPWTPEGKEHAKAAHLSIGGAKVLGGFFLFLGIVGVVGLIAQGIRNLTH